MIKIIKLVKFVVGNIVHEDLNIFSCSLITTARNQLRTFIYCVLDLDHMLSLGSN